MLKFTPSVFFLIVGLVITTGFLFVPAILDPVIIENLPLQTIKEDEELTDYLVSIQDKDNIIIGIHGYTHTFPLTGEAAYEYHSPDQELPYDMLLERVEKGIDAFERAGLDTGWIVPPGSLYDNRLLEVVRAKGYITEDYYVEYPDYNRTRSDMIVKPDILEKFNSFKYAEHGTAFKEYTWGWGRGKAGFDEYIKTSQKLEEDMTASVDGLIIHIQDYNGYTEKFLRQALDEYEKIKFIRVDDVASSYDLANLKNLVSLANETGRMLLVAVIPAHKSTVVSPVVQGTIKTTWFVFLPFFLFPLAVMVPLHWQERKKFRKTKMKSSNLPKISLILPAYNEEKILGTSIERALAQDYKGELEIIIIDDGSTDKTLEIANSYVDKFPDIVKVHKHERNMGKPEGLNTGFHTATGEISVFSDSDSYLNNDLVSKMVPHFEDPKVGMVAGMIVIDNEINLLTRLQQMEYLYNQEIIRFCQHTHKGVLICPGAATAVRTKIAREIPSTERTITEDADFTFEVAEAGWKVTQEPEAVSWTEAPENWKEFINQRKRWLYGVLQTIWIHKWALFFKDTDVPNLWVWWAWIGYITCPITTIAVILMPFFYWWLGPTYLIFLAWYSAIIFLIYGFATWYGLKQYVHEKKSWLIVLLPIYIVYQYILNTLLCYLVFAFIIKKGIHIRYGGRNIHAI